VPENSILLKTYTPEGDLIQETTGTGEQQIAPDQSEGTYFLEIEPESPSKEPVYELSLQQNLPFQAIFPVCPAGQWHNGIALMTPHKDPSATDRTIISLVSRDGFPQISFTDQSPSGHLIGMTDDEFDIPPLTGDEYIKIDSDTPFRGLQIATAENFDLMIGANFIQTENATAELFFPHYDRTDGWQTIFGIINTGEQAEEVSLTSYDPDGYILTTETIELAPGQKWEKKHIIPERSHLRHQNHERLRGERQELPDRLHRVS